MDKFKYYKTKLALILNFIDISLENRVFFLNKKQYVNRSERARAIEQTTNPRRFDLKNN